MNYYSNIKKKVLLRRLLFSIILIALGITCICKNYGEIKKYKSGVLNIDELEIEDRYLDRMEGEYVSIRVVDIQGYVNAQDGEVSGKLYNVFPTKQSGWIVGYEGCQQYCELITTGDDNTKFEEAYTDLLNYDKGEGDKKDISFEVVGKVVKKNTRWRDYFDRYAKVLVESKKYTSVNSVVNCMGGEYMIDMSQSKPILEYIFFGIGILLIVYAILFLFSVELGTDKERLRQKIRRYGNFKAKTLTRDYNDGIVVGNTVIGYRFVYYIKGFRSGAVCTRAIRKISRKSFFMFTKITLIDAKKRRNSFLVTNKNATQLVRTIYAVIDELREYQN